MQFLKESRAKIAHLNYMELIAGLESSENMTEYGCMQSFQLVAPAKPKDWRVIAAYQASLCYALMTRGMIYCENLVLQMKADRF